MVCKVENKQPEEVRDLSYQNLIKALGTCTGRECWERGGEAKEK